ncbi:MAG: pyridoxamine 5'-phosphate oxidase family protein [Pseudomonadales bacterium]|nr:pyridoxamine 5'-phosphate oxidase family protein [Pseudomonadales bacterium]
MDRLETIRTREGGIHPAAVNKIKPYLEPVVRAFIEQSPMLVMASADSQGHCDASPKGGKPGFVRILDDRTLLIPDIGGNRLFQGYANFATNPHTGLVFMIPGMNVTARVNGRVTVMEAEEVAAAGLQPEVSHPDKNAHIVQGIRIEIEEAYLHCPRSFLFGDFWNTDRIQENAGKSLKDL